MTRGLARVIGGGLGALLVLGIAIAYDTSAEVAALEGGRAHLRIGAILIGAAVGAFVGGLIAGAQFRDPHAPVASAPDRPF